MTSTDELRKLLDERGVKYFHNDYWLHKETRWTFGSTGIAIYTEYEKSGNKNFSMVTENDYSPEQAIAATLGGEHAERTCKVVSSYYYDDYDQYEFEFSCGHLVSMYDKEPPNYCPSCGRKIVSP